jgi:hypothetical protein
VVPKEKRFPEEGEYVFPDNNYGDDANGAEEEGQYNEVKEEKPAFQEYEGGVTEFGEYGGDD